MKKTVVVGIDFSKRTIDVSYFIMVGMQDCWHKQFVNSEQRCMEMISWIKQRYNLSSGMSREKNDKVDSYRITLNLVKYDPYLKLYYHRKNEERKHKMNVLNNVRNKLLQGICAVIHQVRNMTRIII